MTSAPARKPINIPREAFVLHVLGYLHCPYVWGGRGHMLRAGQLLMDGRVSGVGTGDAVRVFDCSGVPTTALFELGAHDFRATHNTDKLWNGLPVVETPLLGDLAFYDGTSDSDVGHVEVWLGGRHVLGASGGGSKTLSLEAARQLNARVCIKSNYLSRVRFRGFRSILPLLQGEWIP